jgi:hypothetical protein
VDGLGFYVVNFIPMKWYSDGLRFKCQRCSSCCIGTPGLVFLTKNDLCALSKKMEMPIKDFVVAYCRIIPYMDGYYLSLQENSDFSCVLWAERGCVAYDSRPLQCRTYPFWPSVLETRRTWVIESTDCPGIEKGALIDPFEIEKVVDRQGRADYLRFSMMRDLEGLDEAEILGGSRVDTYSDDAFQVEK